MNNSSPELWTATVALSHAEGMPPPSLQVLSKHVLSKLHVSDAIREMPSDEPENSIRYHFPVEANNAQNACKRAGKRVAEVIRALKLAETFSIESVKVVSDEELNALISATSLETLWMDHPEVVAYWLRTDPSIRYTAEIMTKELTFYSEPKPPAA